MKRKKEKLFYKYDCTITGEQFTVTQKAPSPKELVSVSAYYELHPESDDRPLLVKKKQTPVQMQATETSEENTEE